MDASLIVVMVGLPARGKSYIASKICKYLNWLGLQCRLFNVGSYRRKLCGAHQPADFFSPLNVHAETERMRAAEQAMRDLLEWLEEDNSIKVAIYDATNSTSCRRDWIRKELIGHPYFFLESICDDEDVIRRNIVEVKSKCPDYSGVDPEQALRDFQERIRNYAASYETIEDKEGSPYAKIINLGSQMIINNLKEQQQSRIVFFVMNLHVRRRSIFLCRHGETTHNVAGRIGGNANLSEGGKEFARELPGILERAMQESGEEGLWERDENVRVWTSTLKRTIQTAQHLPNRLGIQQWKALDELYAGLCDGLTYEEITERYPQDQASRDNDKLHYRYRGGGESYADVILRVEPVVLEMERTENLVIIGHQAILRVIFGYLMGVRVDEIPYLRIPLHAVVRVTPTPYGCEVREYTSSISAVDTHRPKPPQLQSV